MGWMGWSPDGLGAAACFREATVIREIHAGRVFLRVEYT